MRPILPLLLAALTCSPVIFAGDAPPPPAAGEGRGQDRSQDRMRRMIEQNPELKGVDLTTPEGKEKLAQVMQKQMEAMAPRMRERMAENQTAARAETKKALALGDEEFSAIEPLLDRVETLRMHHNLVDRAASGMTMMGGRMGRGGPGPGAMNPQLILGDTPLDPTAAEIQAALKTLKALVDDPQANATEIDLALARVRKAREDYTAAMAKAQEELRSVLSRRQEAVLVDRGTLE
jgi:hypothetical protein